MGLQNYPLSCRKPPHNIESVQKTKWFDRSSRTKCEHDHHAQAADGTNCILHTMHLPCIHGDYLCVETISCGSPDVHVPNVLTDAEH